MKTSKLILLSLVVAGLANCSVSYQPGKHKCKCDEKKEEQAAAPMPSQEEMMAKWKDYSTPGVEHQALNSLVGKWTHVTEFWHDPSKAPEKSTGKTEIAWSMGGRFLEMKNTGKAMGMPYEGKGIIGYDKANKEYPVVWYDNMGTGMMVGNAKYDAATKTLVDEGTASCPISGTIKYKAVTTMISPKHFRYEWFTIPAGQNTEIKAMNVEYTRK